MAKAPKRTAAHDQTAGYMSVIKFLSKDRDAKREDFNTTVGPPSIEVTMDDFTYGMWSTQQEGVNGVLVVRKGKQGFMPETAIFHGDPFVLGMMEIIKMRK